MTNAATDYQKVLTEVLQKQIVILGPAITLVKARNVEGVHIDDSGRVTSLDGDPHALSVKVLEQFRELSPLLVKKTMRPLLSAILYSSNTTPSAPQPVIPQPAAAPVNPEASTEAHHDSVPVLEHKA
jgi:hypothetical protein